MIRPLSRRLAALAALLLLAVAAGCGAESGAVGAADVDPREAVRAAFAELDPSVLDVSVSVDATADEILTAMDATDADGADRAAAELLADAHLHLVGAGDDMALDVGIGESTVTEVRVVDSVLYVRVDPDELRRLVDRVDPDTGAELDGMLGMLALLTEGDPRLGFLADLAGGAWISLDLTDGVPGGTADDRSATGLDEELAELLATIVDEHTVVVPEGTARGGERYLVQVETARLLESAAADPRLADALGTAGTDPETLLDELADGGLAPTWELDVVLIDGRLGSIRVDLASLTAEAPAGATLPVLVSFAATPTPPHAPDSHTPVPTDLLGDLLSETVEGMMGGLRN